MSRATAEPLRVRRDRSPAVVVAGTWGPARRRRSQGAQDPAGEGLSEQHWVSTGSIRPLARLWEGAL